MHGTVLMMFARRKVDKVKEHLEASEFKGSNIFQLIIRDQTIYYTAYVLSCDRKLVLILTL